MKKKLLGMVVVAVVAIVAGYNVYISQNHAGAECSSKKYDEGNRCAKLTYC